MRKTEFAIDEYYHIYNRGVDKRVVFSEYSDYRRFLKGLQDFNNKLTREQRELKQGKSESDSVTESDSDFSPLVTIICYCLNPNHFHFILRQEKENGVSIFMQKLGTGYTNYFNKKHDRSGALFQGKFKSSHINTNEYMLYISAYVNCNSEVHKIAEAQNYEWCSFPEYIGKRKDGLCQKEIILGQFKDAREYFDYAKVNAEEMARKKDAEKMIME